MPFIAGFLFGFLGSPHCIGMCGPIALALPGSGMSWFPLVLHRTLYHLGRVVTYAGMGGFVGYLGGRFILPSFQQHISIIAGTVILAAVILPRMFGATFRHPPGLHAISRRLADVIAPLLRARSPGGMFALGFLNGFLPCGFVYLAIATAVVSGDQVNGMIFMTGFGMGTIPAMMTVSLFPRIVSERVRVKVAKCIPVLTVAVGILLIVRGLNLGIPYISPNLGGGAEAAPAEHCH